MPPRPQLQAKWMTHYHSQQAPSIPQTLRGTGLGFTFF
uniref:Uncharacterized protein n=1 Tax=Anguilla anguilla TaxID=7936 RepID=A0A0E9QAU4_ANGAN